MKNRRMSIKSWKVIHPDYADAVSKTAQIVRKELRSKYPETKFSVRTKYNNINVHWEDGPRSAEVEALVSDYIVESPNDRRIDRHCNLFYLKFGEGWNINFSMHRTFSIAYITEAFRRSPDSSKMPKFYTPELIQKYEVSEYTLDKFLGMKV